jgi:hypothetical protein
VSVSLLEEKARSHGTAEACIGRIEAATLKMSGKSM